MALETGVTYIEDLVATNPNEGDNDTLDEADNHMRLIKTAVQGSFPSLGAAAVTKTAAEINDLVEKTDPVLNGTISGTAFLDDDTMADDSAIAVASQQSIKAYIDTKLAGLNTKIIDIGDWNMDTTAQANVAHGLTSSKIRTVTAMIRDDTGAQYYPIDCDDGFVGTPWGYLYVNATNVVLGRYGGASFNGTSFDSTSYNRGWVTIQYTD